MSELIVAGLSLLVAVITGAVAAGVTVGRLRTDISWLRADIAALRREHSVTRQRINQMRRRA